MYPHLSGQACEHLFPGWSQWGAIQGHDPESGWDAPSFNKDKNMVRLVWTGCCQHLMEGYLQS